MINPSAYFPALLFLVISFSGRTQAQEALKVVTYNMHGGHGNAEANLTEFHKQLQGDEQLLCLQEIKPDIWPVVQATFAGFPYVKAIWRETTAPLNLFELPKQEAIALFSKAPFSYFSERLIQIDPAGDQWERKAGFVKLSIDSANSKSVLIGCYHNTYNFNDNDFEFELLGMERFRSVSIEEMQTTSLATTEPYVLLGDFNLFDTKVISPLFDATFIYSSGRDHIASNLAFADTYQINAQSLQISDHDALVARFDVVLRPTQADETGVHSAQTKPPAAGAFAIQHFFTLVSSLLLYLLQKRRKLTGKSKPRFGGLA